MQSCTCFESLIENFKSTLDPLQPWIKGEYKGLEDLVNKEGADLDEKLRRGIEIVGKFTNVQIWKYYCGRCHYTDQLVQLDIYFDQQLDFLMTKETCEWGKLVAEMDRRQSAIAEKLSQLGGEELSEMLEKQEGLSEALLLLRNTETAEQCATIFKPLLEDLILSLSDSGKPKSNDVKRHSKGELKSLKVEMKNGAELVLECCKVNARRCGLNFRCGTICNPLRHISFWGCFVAGEWVWQADCCRTFTFWISMKGSPELSRLDRPVEEKSRTACKRFRTIFGDLRTTLQSLKSIAEEVLNLPEEEVMEMTALDVDKCFELVPSCTGCTEQRNGIVYEN
ncbi:hypothetical protein ACLB2K_019248 [Fragaria x ananassa]